jgi:hypothetical protein
MMKEASDEHVCAVLKAVGEVCIARARCGILGALCRADASSPLISQEGCARWLWCCVHYGI